MNEDQMIKEIEHYQDELRKTEVKLNLLKRGKQTEQSPEYINLYSEKIMLLNQKIDELTEALIKPDIELTEPKIEPNKPEINQKWWKNFAKEHKKAILAGSLVAVALTGCSFLQNRNAVAATPTPTSDKTFNDGKYNVDPLLGETMVGFTNGWVDEFAKNGYDATKQTEAMAVASISTTFSTGTMGKEEFVDKLALGANFSTEEELLTQLNTFGQALEQVIQSGGKIDYSKVLNNKSSIDMVTRFQKIYLNEDKLSFADQQEAFGELVQESMDHMNDYDMLDLYVMGKYVALGSSGNYNGKNLDLASIEVSQLWATSAYDVCCQKLDNCGIQVDGTNEKNYSIDQTLKTALVSYYKDLILDTSHAHKDNEKYYSFNEINNKALQHASTVKVANIDVDKKAEQREIEKADQKGEMLGFPKYTEEDKKNTQPNGTIPSGNHTTVNKVGDTVNTGTVDVNGNKTTLSTEEAGKYFNAGVADRESNKQKGENDFPSKDAYKAYMQGWNYQDKIMNQIKDEYKEETKTEDIITEPEKNTGQTQQKPEQKPQQSQQTPSSNEIPKENIVETTTKTEDTYFDQFYDDILNGNLYDENGNVITLDNINTGKTR